MKNDEKHTRNLRQIEILKIKFIFAYVQFKFYCSVLCVCFIVTGMKKMTGLTVKCCEDRRLKTKDNKKVLSM